jgi:replicative DNA helicase
MENYYRLLHHCIAWEKTEGNQESALPDAVLSVRSDDLYTREDGRSTPSGASVIFDIAISYYTETGSRIPRRELNQRVQVLAKTDPNLYGQAVATIAAAAQYESNGSDIPSIVKHIKQQANSERLLSSLRGMAQEKVWEDPDKARDALSSMLAELAPEDEASQTLIEYNSVDNVQSRIDTYFERMNNPDQSSGVRLGWPTLDQYTGGLNGGQTMFVAADNKTGKSAFCAASTINAICIAEDEDRPLDAVVAHREMKENWQSNRVEAYMLWRHERMHSKRGLPGQMALSRRISDGKLTPDERVIYAEMLIDMAKMKNKLWFIEPNGYNTLEELAAIVRRLKLKRPVGLVYIDALGGQRLGKYGRFTDNKVNELADLARAAEEMAFELDLPVIVEIQERRETAGMRRVDARDVAANSPAAIPQIACYLLRLFKVPGNAKLVEAQMLASRFSSNDWSFPLLMDVGDMLIEEAPMSMLDEIKQLCGG